MISVTSKARNGYFYLGISKKSNFEDGIALMAVNVDSYLNVTYYAGGNETNLSKIVSTSPPEFKALIDKTGFLFGRFFDDQSLQIELNSTLFQQRFPLPFNIFVGVNKNSKPKSAIDFDGKFDESAWINFTDYYNRVQECPSPLLRIETSHPTVFAIALFYHLLLLVLSIAFSGYQPLKSRGVLPIIMAFVLFIELLSDVFSFLSIKSHSIYRYFIYFLRIPILLSLVSIYTIQFIRFLSLLYLNERKQLIFFQNEKPTAMKFQFKLLKYFGKFYVLAPMFIIFFLFYEILLGIVYIIEILVKVDLVIVVGILLVLPISIFNYLIYFIDIIRNFNSFRTCKVYTDDNLFWRMEFYVLGTFNFLVFVIGALTCFYFLIFNIKYLYVWFFIAMTIFHHNLLFTNTIFLLVITIFKLLISCFQTQKKESDLINLLNDEVSKDIFIQFAKSEFSIENVLCYNDLKKYQNESREDFRAQMAPVIYDRYLKGSSSELEVNVTSTNCKKVAKMIESKDFNNSLFESILSEVKVNLSDTYNRFIFSDSYKRLKKMKVLFKEVN